MTEQIALHTTTLAGLLAPLVEMEWAELARPEQKTPAGDWRIWLILAGRGWGKTRTGAEDAVIYGLRHPGSRIAIVAPTQSDARDTCIEGDSGLLSILPPQLVQAWHRSLGELILKNGTRYKLFSAEEPERLRGPQHHRAWCDELCAWPRAEAFDATFLGTGYIGFNLARTASNTWTLYGDGTRNGGAMIEASPYGLFRYYAIPSTGTTNATMTDTSVIAALRFLVTDSNVALCGDNGLESFRATRTASQVNRIEVTGAVTGSPATIAAQGSDTNIDLALSPKGTGRLNISINTANTVTTVGAAGGASALPATPLGYLRTTINGSIRKIPYYLD